MVNKIIKIALFVALLAPTVAFAQILPASAISQPNPQAIVNTYKLTPARFVITTDNKGCTVVYSHPTYSHSLGVVVYKNCPK